MPSEERFISFDLEEIYKAISIKCVKQKLETPPKGELTLIEIDEDNPNTQDEIFLNVNADDGQEYKLSYERKFFAEALVFLCQGSGIPLPSKGQKMLQILKDKIIMKIVLNSAD